MKHRLTVAGIGLLLALPLLTSLVGCAPAAAQPPAAPTQAQIEPTTPPQTESDSPWEVVFQIRVTQPVRMAAFLDDTFGLTGGPDNAGRAQYTTDGGQTWTMAERSSGCLFGLDIVDAQAVWECNASDIRLSTDGGQTWQGTPRGRGQPFCQVSSADRDTAWYLSPRRLETTLDAGTTWEEVSLPEGVETADILAISLRAPGAGYVLDSSGTLYTTLDSGQNWSPQNLGLEERYGAMKPLPPGNIAAAAMRFLDADHGVIVMSLIGGGSSKLVALRTADGGQTWMEESVPTEFGTAYLAHDGRLLTVHSFFNAGQITVLRYTGD
jgi:photosystem II stability/assembly factor-like uncharacterized protein